MTQPFDDEYGDRLRRALHAEAEAVAPSPEGLERIRSKINDRHERRFGFSFAAPWLRPLAAVTAALFVCGAAVSATPALKNFVQTGHFSSDSGNGDPGSASNSGRSQGQVLPGGSSNPVPNTSPSPSSIRPSNTGKHVVNGTCEPGESTVTPSSTPTATPVPGPIKQITCQPTAGGDTSSAPVTEGPPTPPVTSPPEVPPSDQPTSESAPNANQSP